MILLMLVSIPLLPLLAASALLLSKHSLSYKIVPLVVFPGVLALWMLEPGVEATIPWLLLQTHIGLTDTTQVYLAFTIVLWGIASVYALTYHKDDPHRRRFFIFFSLCMAGNLGLIVARDIASFYLFFALMSFAAYGLVVHEGHQRQRRAGRIYLILVVTGEIALFSAFVLMAGKAEGLSLQALTNIELSPVVIALLVTGFGIKMGVTPFHFWLPLAHASAPTPASAVLSGAMIKAGLLGLIQILPLGSEALPGWGMLLTLAGVASVFYGVMMGVSQIYPKTVLAYSSVSQMGVITALVGIGLREPDVWPLLSVAVLVYAAHHALVKGTLFLGVGAAAGRIHRTKVMIGLGIMALALAGAPLTSGISAKLELKQALHGYPTLVMALTVASVGTTLLMARFIYTLIHYGIDKHKVHSSPIVSWFILLSMVLIYPWLWSRSQAGLLRSFELSLLVSVLWPIIVGITLAFLVSQIVRRRKTPLWLIPEGDIVVLLERWLRWGFTYAKYVFKIGRRQQMKMVELSIKHTNTFRVWDGSRIEATFGLWQIAGLCYLSLLVVLLILLISGISW